MSPTEWRRQQFATHTKHKCWRCLCHLTYEIATVDHIRPRSLGGKDRPSNYRLCCYRCNQTRGNRPLDKAERRRLYTQQPKRQQREGLDRGVTP